MNHDDGPTISGLKLKWREFPVERPYGGPSDPCAVFGIWVLDDPSALLDQLTDEEFQETDERMPYFGQVWPSAEALVAHVLAGPRWDGQQVLDLGCGLGPSGFAAAQQGAEVTFFDWEPRALEIVEASAREQGPETGPLHFVVGDWRDPPKLDPFDCILGADLLYEARNAQAVAAFIAGHLKSGAEAWIADPGRLQAGSFPELAEGAGLQLIASKQIADPDPESAITLLRLRQRQEGREMLNRGGP